MGADNSVPATPASPIAIARQRKGDAGVADTNLVALLTAPAPAAIAVVRLIGPAVADFAARHLSKPPRLNRCVHCNLRDGDETIDDAVAVLVDGNRLDLNLHGGPWVVEATLRLAEREGFERASWQTATDAATDLEAEVAAALPFAVTREALAILLAQPAAWEAMLARNDPAKRRLAIADRAIGYILRPPTVAIVGEPNAGKSTLLNRLAGQARSITADVPGTTRDYVTTPANLRGLIVNLVDTPGHRETTDPIETEAIARAMEVIAKADAVIELRDATAPPPNPPREGAILVWNKTDLATAPPSGVAASAATGAGIDALITKLLSALQVDDLTSSHARCWTPRQRRLIGADS